MFGRERGMMLLFSEDRVEELRPKVRFRIAHQVGWACADLEDLVQETLTRLLLAVRQNKVRDPAGMGGFLNGICRNVVFEYRRRLLRDDIEVAALTLEPIFIVLWHGSFTNVFHLRKLLMA